MGPVHYTEHQFRFYLLIYLFANSFIYAFITYTYFYLYLLPIPNELQEITFPICRNTKYIIDTSHPDQGFATRRIQELLFQTAYISSWYRLEQILSLKLFLASAKNTIVRFKLIPSK